MKIKSKQSVTNRTDFFYYAFRNVLLVGLPLTIISALALSLPHSSATTSSADHLDFSIPVSCTLSSNIESAHSATLLNGTYKDNIGKTILTTYCNDQNGYTVYTSAMSKNSSGQSVLLSADSSTYDIVTGTATSGSTSAWAMKLNNIEGDTSPTPPTIEPSYLNTYAVVPNTWTKVASKSNGTVNSQTGSSFTATYAVYTSTTQPAGNYTGLVRYMLLHDNQTIPTPTYFMQDVAFWKDDLTLNQSVQAIDERDGKKYWVTKLADGNIWMTQNLDLCIGCDGVATLTSENTDLTDHSLSGAYSQANGYSYDATTGITTWTPASTTVTSNSIVNYSTNAVSNWTSSNNAPASAEGGDTYFYTSGNNNSDTRFDSLGACEYVGHTEAECKHYHAGNYYNWTAAIASNNSSGLTTKANNSICPSGWLLPSTSTTDDVYNEFGRLFYNSAYNITNNIAGSGNAGYKTGGFNALRTSPLWFVRSGYLDNSALANPALNGLYWSNRVNNGSSAYSLTFSSSDIYPANGTRSRYYGFSIRCLAR